MRVEEKQAQLYVREYLQNDMREYLLTPGSTVENAVRGLTEIKLGERGSHLARIRYNNEDREIAEAIDNIWKLAIEAAVPAMKF